jgi:transcriptional regulator with XRE-family HTH domain
MNIASLHNHDNNNGEMGIDNLNRAFLNILQEKGITSPKTLSEMTGIDKATISRQMSNKQALSLNNIARYAEVLKVPKGKFIEEYVPSYWIVGYVDRSDGKVTGRHEEDPQKVIFPNEWTKKENEKILYDKQTKHLLRYNLELNQDTVDHKKLYNTYCFVRTKEQYMAGSIGFVTNIKKNNCQIIYLDGKTGDMKEFYMIYVITSTHNMKFQPNDIAVVDG